MTPKEKAEELINRFENETHSLVKDEDAKQCALITVDEILEVTGGHINQFYQNVKNELFNL